MGVANTYGVFQKVHTQVKKKKMKGKEIGFNLLIVTVLWKVWVITFEKDVWN